MQVNLPLLFRTNGMLHQLWGLRNLIGRLSKPPGIQIAVLGPDGSGKSTLLAGLERELSDTFRGVYRGHFRPGLEAGGAPRTPETQPHLRPPRSTPASLAKLVFYAVDHFLGYVVQTIPRRQRGALILYDRHFADIGVDPLRYRYGASVRLAGLAARLVPQPDVTLVLIAPVNLIQQRRQEVPPEETARQVEAYRALAAPPHNAHLLDASGSPESVLRDALTVIRDIIGDRLDQQVIS